MEKMPGAEMLVDGKEKRVAETSVWPASAQLDVLRQMGVDLMAELDLDVLLRSIVSRAIQLLGGTSGGLHLYRPEEDALEWTTVVGPNKPAAGVKLRRGEGLAGRIWETGRPLIIDDYRRWEGRASAFEGFAWTAVVGVPVRWGDEFLGVLDIVGEEPISFNKVDAETLSLFASYAAIAIRNAQILATAEEQRRRAEALAQATMSLTSTLDLGLLLDNVLAAAVRAIPAAEKGGILISDEDTGRLRVDAVLGYHDPRIRQGALIQQRGYAAWVARQGRPLLISDAQAKPFAYQGEIEEIRTIRSAIVAPLSYHSRLIGSLTLENSSRTGAFTDDDLRLLVAFADQAAVAVENARLYAKGKRQRELIRALAMRLSEAEEAQRQQIAQDLHDEVGQSLAVLGINLTILESQLGEQAQADVEARLKDSAALVKHTTQRIRNLMAELRPPILDDYGLLAVLRWYAEHFTMRTGLTVMVLGKEFTPRLPRNAEISLFRIAQEALTNVVKHSQADQVQVTLDYSNKLVCMAISDNGVGFDTTQLASPNTSSGWGLLTMRERAEALGGRCHVESTPQSGTKVWVEVPR
jgi:signal transduction histidine kinase